MIRKNISLKKYNSFNIDVNAKEFVEVNSKDELIEIANRTKDKNVLYLGGGSNILFTRDFDGIVIHLNIKGCLLYTSPSPRDVRSSRMPSSA